MSVMHSRRLSPVIEIASGLSGFSLSSASSERSIIDLTHDLERIDGLDGYLGAGGYADVYKYRVRETSTMYAACRTFAVKSARYFNRDAKKATLRTGREMNIWASLNHENVLKLHGFVWIDGNPLPCLVSDNMENGTARDYLKGNSDINLIRMIRDIARGLLYLHGREIAHGDIKADNILVGRDGRAKLGDFGISRMLGEDGVARETSTTDANRSSRWTACENIKVSYEASPTYGPSKPGDVWSFGCTVLELFSGRLPFYDAIEAEVPIRLDRQEAPSFPPSCVRQEFERYRVGITAFCSLCWVREPKYRPTMTVLEPVISSYCSGMACGHTETEERTPLAIDCRPLPKQAHSSNPRTPDPTDGLESGLRSRSSSESTLVSIPSDEVPDIQIVSPEQAEQPSAISDSPVDSVLGSEAFEPSPNPNTLASPIPPPPPPTLETMLGSNYRSAQDVLYAMSSKSLGTRVELLEGEPSVNTFTYSCKVNGVEYGVATRGNKKHAKEMAARAALERLRDEDPARFPILRYFAVVKDHLRSQRLGSRFQFPADFHVNTTNPGTGEYTVSFVFDGEKKVEGVGPSLISAEEDVARNVAASWSRLFGIADM